MATEQFRRHVVDMKSFLLENNIGAMPVADQEGAFRRFLDSDNARLRIRWPANGKRARSPFFEDLAYRAGLTGAVAAGLFDRLKYPPSPNSG